MKFIQRQGDRKGGQSAILSSGQKKHFRSIVVWGTSLVHLWKQEDCYQSLKEMEEAWTSGSIEKYEEF